ncbi:hypothetical protein F4779DRAFT_616775 [Xylariaceae sp. FL0662B]|nr:hypothetical protein F4779DRAFT_616775 [Xylariaceae sp. FL0662B]
MYGILNQKSRSMTDFNRTEKIKNNWSKKIPVPLLAASGPSGLNASVLKRGQKKEATYNEPMEAPTPLEATHGHHRTMASVPMWALVPVLVVLTFGVIWTMTLVMVLRLSAARRAGQDHERDRLPLLGEAHNAMRTRAPVPLDSNLEATSGLGSLTAGILELSGDNFRLGQPAHRYPRMKRSLPSKTYNPLPARAPAPLEASSSSRRMFQPSKYGSPTAKDDDIVMSDAQLQAESTCSPSTRPSRIFEEDEVIAGTPHPSSSDKVIREIVNQVNQDSQTEKKTPINIDPDSSDSFSSSSDPSSSSDSDSDTDSSSGSTLKKAKRSKKHTQNTIDLTHLTVREHAKATESTRVSCVSRDGFGPDNRAVQVSSNKRVYLDRTGLTLSPTRAPTPLETCLETVSGLTSLSDSNLIDGNRIVQFIWSGQADSDLEEGASLLGRELRDDFVATSGYRDLVVYVNYADGDETLEQIYGQKNLPRLSALKKTWVPYNVFAYGIVSPTDDP